MHTQHLKLKAHTSLTGNTISIVAMYRTELYKIEYEWNCIGYIYQILTQLRPAIINRTHANM